MQTIFGYCTGAVFAITCASVAALSGCNSNNSSTPSVAPSALPTIAGDYTGTVTDSVAGAGTSAITIAQSGSSVGGNLVLTYGAASQTMTLAATINTSGSVSGSAVSTVANVTCGYTVTGNYDGTNNVLNGNYTAFSGCTGQTGSFALTQQCTDPVTSSVKRQSSAARRVRTQHSGILPC